MISWKKRQYSTKKLYLCSLNNKKVVFYTFKMGQLQERYKSYRLSLFSRHYEQARPRGDNGRT